MRHVAAWPPLIVALLAASAATAQTGTSAAAPAGGGTGLVAPDPAALMAACHVDASQPISTMSAARLRDTVACFQHEIAVGLNRGAPVRVDNVTVLQSVSSEGPTLTYHFRLDRLRAELAGVRDQIVAQVRARVCATPEMSRTIGYGGAYRYLWYDRNSELVAELLVSSC